MIEFGQLRRGERYEITFNDCCVQGKLIGTFEGYGVDRELAFDEDAEDDFATFDFGRIGPYWGQLDFKHLPSGLPDATAEVHA